MPDLTRDDLSAAVDAGVITAAGAEALLRHAAARQAARAVVQDEPLPLFRGVNDILMAIAATMLGVAAILLVIWVGGLREVLAAAPRLAHPLSLTAAALACALLIPAWLAGREFARRRAELPGLAATVFGGVMLGLALAKLLSPALPGLTLWLSGGENSRVIGFQYVGGFIWLGIGLWGALMRMTVRTAFPLGAMALGLTFGAARLTEAVLSTMRVPFSDGWRAAGGGWSPALGLICAAGGALALVAALRFDLSDRLRVSYAATCAFWLHMAAACLISGALLYGFVLAPQLRGGVWIAALLAVPLVPFALIIDRRSFLTVAMIWIFAGLMASLRAPGFQFADRAIITALCFMLVGGGALALALRWPAARRALMTAAPSFPGKDRLPPWDAASAARP